MWHPMARLLTLKLSWARALALVCRLLLMSLSLLLRLSFRWYAVRRDSSVGVNVCIFRRPARAMAFSAPPPLLPSHVQV